MAEPRVRSLTLRDVERILESQEGGSGGTRQWFPPMLPAFASEMEADA